MKKRDSVNKKLLCIGAVCSLVSLFTACEALGPEPEPEPVTVSYEKAVVRVQIGNGVPGRTVRPDVASQGINWKLRGKLGDNTETPLLEFDVVADAAIALEPGEWSFTVDGYKDGDSAPVLSGSIEDKTISLEGENVLLFEVEPVKNEGSGDISITINLPADSGITSVEVFKDGVELIPSEAELTLSITPVGDTIVFTKTFPVEEYRFSFRLRDAEAKLLGVVSEMVHVWADLTSAKTYTLLQKDLNLTYTISYLIYNEATQAWEKFMPDGYYQIAATTKLAMPPRPGYYFKGWYDNKDFSGSAVTKIPVGSTGNRAFYSKWIPKTPSGDTISGYSLADALDLIKANPEDGDAYTIVLNNDADAAPTTLSPTPLSYDGKKVNITLKGDGAEQTLSLDSKGSLFTLGSGVTLSLDANITLEGLSDNTASLVAVNSNGKLEMNYGSKISGNTGPAAGGGVMVSSGGMFTMTDGEISGNNASRYGGGVFVGGTFNMTGGKISGNTADGESEGGGVHINPGTFNMSGGEVSGNNSKTGGGVFVSVSGTFNLSDKGAISGNTATDSGGGVYLNRNNSKFTLSGGAISGNTATNYGGGVYVAAGLFTMNNGAISHNTAKRGGGVYRNSGTFTKASGGFIYGSDADTTLKNTATDGDAYGHAVYDVAGKKRDSTVEENEPLSSASSDNWLDHWPVTFDVDGGTPVTQPARVNSGESLGALMPPDSTRDGYAFGGWYTEQNGGGTQFTAATTVSGAITVYANWQYTVTFDLDDGTFVTETRTVNSGDPVDAAMPSDPTRSDYAFGGWYTAQNGEGTQFAANTPVTGNITVYALWLP
ncbi:MAG: InlB B-repeat-containing protein [Treponema sp.]|jgi:uncharacterized repeat protein (TIGR02543 family)|nr:InlB B-repeat-containing protein [Treponema sp.]